MKLKNICFLLLTGVLIARPDSFANVSYYADSPYLEQHNVIDQDKATFLLVEQTLEIEFKPVFYFRKMLFYFQPGAVPLKIQIAARLASNEQFQIVKEVNVRGHLVEGLFLVTVDLEDIAAKGLQITFPDSVNRQIKLAEIEFYPNMQLETNGTLSKPLLITDKEVYLEFKADKELQAVFQLNNQGRVLQTPSIANRKEHNIWLHGLTPNTVYQAKVLMQDYLANIDETPEIIFQTKSENLALNKKVFGTFNYYQPDDSHVSQEQPEPIKQINDGDDSYFTSMATSADPEQQAQYVVIDLGNKQQVSELIIIWRALAYSKNYQVEISDDNLNWQTVLSSLNAVGGKFGYSRTGDPVRITQHKLNKKFRYLKIFIPQKSAYYVVDPNWKFVQIMDIKLFN